MKPEPEIYEALLYRHGLIGSESVFIDDLHHNIEAAKQAGLYGIVYHDRKQAERKLKELGVEF